ncbi:MAG: hypothetical protein AVDCRST_MAG36-44 [uncultured Nocardioidaceae bacterium]|uniref:Uncharacterized protein n=1 Tax=uncultured Nocardioidaceae bacterium TaxID=253824 RepID=A0A6J4KTS1_9ACTN|nr:MAG: hypothetical protein AVDCRST_MAG36-44 [uncultured Nocardioidaceae bacterium]
MAEPAGVQFPVAADGRRSTAAVGRGVVADALRRVDPVGAAAAERETSWRTGYVPHFRRLVEAGLGTPDAARRIAADGLGSLHGRMRVVQHGEDRPLATWAAGGPPLQTVEVRGTGERAPSLVLPFRGRRLAEDALLAQLDRWVEGGVVEPSVTDAVRQVVAHPEWLRLDGWTVGVVGAGAEMGPTRALLRWGARVAALDLPVPRVWERLVDDARERAGTLLVPVRDPSGGLTTSAGVDLAAAAPDAAAWLAGLDRRLVVGNYVYADGADGVRVSVAVDALTTAVTGRRDDTALGFLATPTDVFAVPAVAVRHATQAHDRRSRAARLAGRPLRTLSGGRLLQRPYAPGSDPGVNDSLVPQQGPNYALAKRLQRWRATTERAEGRLVSLRVAPPTRTRSVLKNRALAAAYAGAHRFGVEVFEPATANVLMAALLVHDLSTGGGPRHAHPWQDEAWAAVHGGLWRAPYAPRSALGLAAVLGYGAARG